MLYCTWLLIIVGVSMFAKLKGIVDTIEEDSIVLDVQGVGYLVYIPQSLTALYQENDSVCLFIQTIVKEDAINLYGFNSLSNKKLFNLLITVQGVGPKIALLMLSKMSLADLQKSILLEDVVHLKSIPGVGLKVAQRLINELKDKISHIEGVSNSSLLLKSTSASSINLGNPLIKEVVSALQGLGYSTIEINKAMDFVNTSMQEDITSEELLKLTLQYFAKGLESNG